MKRGVVALILVVALSMTLFAGFAAAGEEGQSYKIGVVLSEGTSKYIYDNVNNVIESMGGTAQWEDFDFTPESMISGTEKLITAGCDGIMVIPPSDAALPKVAQMCDEAGVPWGIFLRSINDEGIRNMVLDSETYVGNTYEDEVEAGYKNGQMAGESGAKKVAIISTAKGDTTGDNREIGFKQACDEYGIEIVAEARALSQTDEVTKAVESFVASYPDLDAVCVVASQISALEAACQGIRETGSIGKVLLFYGDFTTGMTEALEEGIVLGFNGGHISYDPTICAGIVYNAVQGTPISEEKMSIKISTMSAMTVEDAQDYYKYVQGDMPLFFPDEVDSLLNKAANPAITVEDYIALGENYGIDDLRARHGDR